MSQNAIAYLRCSDLKQDRSVRDQRDAIVARAQKDGIRIVQWFEDDGISGTTVEKRPGILALRKWVQETDCAGWVLYAWAQSRLGRDTADTVMTLAQLDDARVTTRFLTDPEPEDEEARGWLRLIRAQNDAGLSKRLSKDVRRGMTGVAKEGRWTNGRPPYGYRVDHAIPGKAGSLVADAEEAEVIREVYRLYIEGGLGFKGVGVEMTRRGVHPPTNTQKVRARSESVWWPKHARQIIESGVYCGRITYKENVLSEGKHEAIIPVDRWEQAQAIRRGRYRARTRVHPMRAGERGILTPYLSCGACGGRVAIGHSHAKSETYYYNCSSRLRHAGSCSGLNARVAELDGLVLGAVAGLLTDRVGLRALAERRRAYLVTDGRSDIAAKRSTQESKIAAADAVIKRALSMVARGLAEEAEVVDEISMQRRARDEARDQLAGLPVPLPLPEVDDAAVDRLVVAVRTALIDGPVIARRKALSKLLKSVVLQDGAVKITFMPQIAGEQNPRLEPSGGPSGSW
ncbi:recombinase family protein [Deltaproteobacteria bacterium]|nr:recombinase family protein [Deltaproteobacteria bacterium]